MAPSMGMSDQYIGFGLTYLHIHLPSPLYELLRWLKFWNYSQTFKLYALRRTFETTPSIHNIWARFVKLS